MAKSWGWDSYGRKGLDIAHSASTLGFSAAKVGTRLGVSAIYSSFTAGFSYIVYSFRLPGASLLV